MGEYLRDEVCCSLNLKLSPSTNARLRKPCSKPYYLSWNCITLVRTLATSNEVLCLVEASNNTVDSAGLKLLHRSFYNISAHALYNIPGYVNLSDDSMQNYCVLIGGCMTLIWRRAYIINTCNRACLKLPPRPCRPLQPRRRRKQSFQRNG